MKLSFRNRDLVVFDATTVAEEMGALQMSHSEHGAALPVVSLDVSSNRLQQFLSGSLLTHLTDINLSHNQLRHVAEMPRMLQRAQLSHNRLVSLEGLAHCSQLTFLDVQVNELSDDALCSVPSSVTTLVISDNQVRSLRCLLHVSQLLKLLADGNNLKKVSDIVCLAGLRFLRHLTLRGNPVCTNSRLIPSLTSNLPKLTTLDRVSLAQAQANRIYQVQLDTKRAEAASHARELSTIHASLNRTRRAIEEHTAHDAVELRLLEAKVEELERLFSAENKERDALSRRNAQLSGQLEQLESVRVMQEWDLGRLRDDKAVLLAERRSLVEAEGSLNDTFGTYRAQIMSQRFRSAPRRR